MERLGLANGKMIAASSYGANMDDDSKGMELTDEEKTIQSTARVIWQRILNLESVVDETDFFACGAGSMDVVRSVDRLEPGFH